VTTPTIQLDHGHDSFRPVLGRGHTERRDSTKQFDSVESQKSSDRMSRLEKTLLLIPSNTSKDAMQINCLVESGLSV